MIVAAVSPTVTASIPGSIASCGRFPSAIFAAVLRFSSFLVFLAIMIGHFRVPGSMGSSPGKAAVIRERFQAVIIRRGGIRFRLPLMLPGGLEALTTLVIRGMIPHGFLRERFRRRTIVLRIHAKQKGIAEPLIGRLRMRL